MDASVRTFFVAALFLCTTTNVCSVGLAFGLYIDFFFSIQNWAEDLISGNTTTGRILVVFAFTCSMVSFVLYIISKLIFALITSDIFFLYFNQNL